MKAKKNCLEIRAESTFKEIEIEIYNHLLKIERKRARKKNRSSFNYICTIMMLMTTAVGTFAYNIKVNSVELIAVALVLSVVTLWVRVG